MYYEYYFDRTNFGGCGGMRNHTIPPKEELIVLGISNYDEIYEKEKKIIWVIPRRFVPFYLEEIKKGNNRCIDIVKDEDIKRR